MVAGPGVQHALRRRPGRWPTWAGSQPGAGWSARSPYVARHSSVSPAARKARSGTASPRRMGPARPSRVRRTARGRPAAAPRTRPAPRAAGRRRPQSGRLSDRRLLTVCGAQVYRGGPIYYPCGPTKGEAVRQVPVPAPTTGSWRCSTQHGHSRFAEASLYTTRCFVGQPGKSLGCPGGNTGASNRKSRSIAASSYSCGFRPSHPSTAAGRTGRW
jgi:hypothetical protein